MALLTVTGGPVPPAGKTLATGTSLVVRYFRAYVDGETVHATRHEAEWDQTTGGWKPVGAADGTPFLVPGAAAGDALPPYCRVVEKQVYTTGDPSISARPPERIVETAVGAWAYAS